MPKYIHALDPITRNFVEYQIKHYPESLKQLEMYHADITPRTIINYEKKGSCSPAGGAYRPTESAALRICTNEYIRQLELTVLAIKSVYIRLSPADQELIKLKYWSINALTVDGIALKLSSTKSTICRRLNNILVEIARRLGYINLF